VSAGQAIGADVGGTKIAALRITATGEVVDREVRPTPADDPAGIAKALEEAIAAVVDDGVVGVGVGAAGLIDVTRGVLLFSPNLAWRQVPLRERLSDRFGVPVTIDNDATAAAWAESRIGASRGYGDSLFVGVGTGIGGGIVSGGRLFRGARGLAGEIGHVIVEPGGPPCGCGNRGCWEQIASGHAIARAGARAVLDNPSSRIAELAEGDPRRATGELVTRAAVEGDAAAVAILAEVGRRLGEGVAGLVNVLDPEIVVVGGGVAEVGDLLLEPIRRAYAESVEGGDVRADVPIVPAALGNDAGAIGAALLAIEAAAA
jgi:glucokinase